MAVYVSAKRLGDDRTRFRATLATLWLLLNTANVVTSALLLPGLLVGTLAGTWAHPRIPQRAFRLGVFVLLTAAAAVLIARSV